MKSNQDVTAGKVIKITDQAWLQELDLDKHYVLLFEGTPPKIKWADKPANVSDIMLRADSFSLEDIEAVRAALSPQPRTRKRKGTDAIPTQSKDSEEK